MELKPGQPVFTKEVHGNVWKTGVIDQPAKEPESYWIKFPDNSIPKRTRSMIKPRSQPSYFELEAEGKEWNSTGIIPPHFHQPFNSMLPVLELPALPMDNYGFGVKLRVFNSIFNTCLFSHFQPVNTPKK